MTPAERLVEARTAANVAVRALGRKPTDEQRKNAQVLAKAATKAEAADRDVRYPPAPKETK